MFVIFVRPQPASTPFPYTSSSDLPGTSNDKYGNVLTNAGANQVMWLRLDMPTSITGASVAQTMTLLVTGQGS